VSYTLKKGKQQHLSFALIDHLFNFKCQAREFGKQACTVGNDKQKLS